MGCTPPPRPPSALELARPFLVGGVASCVAEVATFPIDTAKTRLQLQGQTIERRFLHRPYRGMLDVWRRVISEEGSAALYRGLSPALLRQAVYGTIKFGLYRTAKDYLAPAGEESTAKNVACAIFAGSVASAVANPTDVMKVRLQQRASDAAVLVGGAKNLRGAFADVWRREGVRGLWRGATPTAQRAAVVAGVQLPVYDMAKTQLLRHRWLTDGPANHLVSSFMAGLAASLASCPVDVVRTRLMGQRRLKLDEHGVVASGQTRVYRGSFHCLTATVRSEGLTALYKGFVPSFVRMGPWNIIFFLVYEQLMRNRGNWR